MPSISKKTTLNEFAAIISDAFENAVHTLGRYGKLLRTHV